MQSQCLVTLHSFSMCSPMRWALAYKYLRMSSTHAELQSLLNAWLGRAFAFSLGTWPSKPTDSEMLSIKAKSLLLHTPTSVIELAVASSSAATTAMPSSTPNFMMAKTSSSRNRRVKNCNCPPQSAFVETDHKMARRPASSCLPWSPSVGLGCPRYRCCCRCSCLTCTPVDSHDVFC